MSRPGRDRGPVPNRWLRCPRKANELILKKFMAFKTPLCDDFNEKVPAEFRFPPKMLLASCKAQKINFGLWIDLTNTSRFYDKSEIENEGCAYLKLQCRGHGETPSVEVTNTFITVVKKFIAQNPLKSIAVHCTHGFNRTGFLIVSYIVATMDYDIQIALDMFARARPPGIYKGDYLQELFQRYYDVEDTPPPPELPNWCFDEEDGEDGGEIDSLQLALTDQPSNSESTAATSAPAPRMKKRNGKRAVFMQGVPNVVEFTEQPKAFQLQKKVQVMCKWKSKGFPGSQPVSMDINNIKLLQVHPYRVSWKADGMRYIMLIDGPNEVYFFDRDHNIFHVDGLRFPFRKDLNRHLINTLIDGEMVIDKVNGQDIPRYLAYDIIQFEGKPVGDMPFYPNRLQYIDYEIIKPRYAAMEAGIINKAAEPFSVRHKQFWDITQAGSLLGEKFAATLSHEPDGLIFQPSKEPYIAGRCDNVLKWKPLDMNSVDFRLKIVKQEGQGIVSQKVCYLYVGQLEQHFGMMKYNKSLAELDGKIVECKYENSQWKFMRERTDKSYPNSYNTAQAVCGSIKHPITSEKLLSFIANHRFVDESELMRPPPSKKIRR